MTAMHPQLKARQRKMKSVEADGVGVWTRIKSWMPKLRERVGKVGVWKRLDLASLKRTQKDRRNEGKEAVGVK